MYNRYEIYLKSYEIRGICIKVMQKLTQNESYSKSYLLFILKHKVEHLFTKILILYKTVKKEKKEIEIESKHLNETLVSWEKP